jgi:spermidine dehydrogenase
MNGRKFLYTTAAMDRSARNQLTHTLAGTDSDLDGDIAAITINRWGHGLIYQYNSLWDALWMDGKALPCEKARNPFGRVTIANSDSDTHGWAMLPSTRVSAP